MAKKLVVCIMGQDCERFIDMCLESVKDADAIVFCDGGTEMKEPFFELSEKLGFHADYIQNDYDQEDKAMNGKQRNFYLKYLKKNYPDYWALCLDADEVVDDLSKIKSYIQKYSGEKAPVHNIHMRHLIGDLGHEDAIQPRHYVLNRLFKISGVKGYPEVEHPVLQPKNDEPPFFCDDTTIWHLAYIPNLWEIKKRYDNHLKKSNIHTPEYLKEWYWKHLFGTYPRSDFDPVQLPRIILNKFGIDKDELYFLNRNLETKHFIDAIHWRDFFKCKTAMEFGCGKGPRVFAMNNVGIIANGLELSQHAVANKMHKNIIRGDITKNFTINPVDLVIAYDLLEHIPYKKLDHSIDNLIKSTKKHIMISVPTIGDPNLEADPTHIIKETKDWWIDKFLEKGLNQIITPEHFLYGDQVMIFKK